MSRRVNANTRGRAAQRAPKLKLSFGGKSGQKNGSREVTNIARTTKKRKLARYSDTESTTSGGVSADDEDDDEDDESEEADDESEDPEVDAPSRFTPMRSEAGLPPFERNTKVTVDPGEWTGFPEPDDDMNVELFDVEDIEKKLFDSDDDVVYEQVNEVSDSDEDDHAVEKAETELLAAEFNEDWTSHFANQIDGMSAYGFGDDSEEEGSDHYFPFSSGDEANETRNRHVHFEEQHPIGMASAFAALADSPTMTRALLPSAMPVASDDLTHDEDAQDDAEHDYDSDATEELDEPDKAWQLLASARKSKDMTNMSPPAVPKRNSVTRGPIRGTFEDNGDKVTAILDSTGKKLLLSDPHLLGGVFARRFGPSAPASPSVSFSDAVFGESDSSVTSASPRPQTAQLAAIDPMMSGLISGEHAAVNGQATGMPEAFIPATASFLNDFITTDIFDSNAIDPEETLRIEDMIAFGDDDDDTDNPDSPMLPNFQPSSLSAPNTPLPHLNHMNVAAFRRGTESTYFASSPHATALRNQFTTPLKRKRKPTRFDSPYNDAHYQGVTPVQRITAQEHDFSSSPAPSSSHMHKRRKTIL